MTRREKEEILAAYRSGESSTAIGSRYGVHPAYVRKLAARAGQAKRPAVGVKLPPKPKRQYLPQPRVAPQHMGSGRHVSTGYLKLM